METICNSGKVVCMKKKFLSLLIAGCLIAGIGLNAQCLAAQKGHHSSKTQHHRVVKKSSHKPAVKRASNHTKSRYDLKQAGRNSDVKNRKADTRFSVKRNNNKYSQKPSPKSKKNFKNVNNKKGNGLKKGHYKK